VLADHVDHTLVMRALEEGAHNYLDKEKLTGAVLARAIRFSMEVNTSTIKLRNEYSSLKLSEHRYSRLFFDHHLIAAVSLSTIKEDRFVQVNEIFLRFFGFTENEVIGKTTSDLNIWVDDSKPKDFVWRIIDGQVIKNENVRVRTKNGTIIDVLFSMDIIETEVGPMVLTVSQNLTDYLEPVNTMRESEKGTINNNSSNPIWEIASQKLIDSESRYRSLVEQASDAIFITDRKGEYVDVNPKACELLGYTREELLSMNVSDIILLEEKSKRIPGRAEVLKKRKPGILEVRFKKSDNTPVNVEINGWLAPDGQYVEIVRDLSERKDAQKAEGEMQERLKAIFNGTTDAILLADDSGKIVQVNLAAQKMLGYDEEELLSKNSVEIFLPDEEVWDEFIKGEKSADVITLTRKGGTPVICRFNLRTNILPGFHLSILTDITENKRAEDLLRKSESGLAEAQRLAQYGSWELNILTDEITWSDELFRIFGREKGTFPVSYLSFLSCVDEPERQKIHQQIQSAYDAEKPFDIEYHITTPGGERRDIHGIGKIKRDSERKITGFFGTAQNITERKKTEEAVIESEKKYHYLFENNPLPMWVMDKETLALLEVNLQALRNYGYSREEFLSLPYAQLKAPAEKKRFRDFQHLISEEPYNAGIWKHLKKDQTVMDVEILLHDIEFHQQKAYLLIVTDVTEKFKSEEELKSSYQQLKDLTARLQNILEDERTRIARAVHDELGQQLTALKMDASWISNRINIDDKPIQGKLGEMMMLIDETVKTVRRISAELRPGILDDLGLIPALEWQGEEFERRTGIQSKFLNGSADFGVDRDISTNIFRVYQEVLTNVARHSNATSIETTIEESNGWITLTIKDNGIGFDPEDAKNKKSLGLLGMRERALMFHGELTVETGNERGTIISLRMPVGKGGTKYS
jgi:two-component system sensor histidine kinase UhpB